MAGVLSLETYISVRAPCSWQNLAASMISGVVPVRVEKTQTESLLKALGGHARNSAAISQWTSTSAVVVSTQYFIGSVWAQVPPQPMKKMLE